MRLFLRVLRWFRWWLFDRRDTRFTVADHSFLDRNRLLAGEVKR